MNPSQLKRQKIAGFLLPILLGWFLVVLLIVVTLICLFYWVGFGWPFYLLGAAWLSLIPMVGYGMGILSAYCWQRQEWNEQTRREKCSNLLIYFWVFSPVTYLLMFSGFGIVILPIHGVCFYKGHEIGQRWTETDMFNQLLGRSNEWERNKLE